MPSRREVKLTRGGLVDRIASAAPSQGGSITDWRASSQGLVAVRDFADVIARFGSFASFRGATGLRDMSAMPPIAIAVDASQRTDAMCQYATSSSSDRGLICSGR